MDCMVEFAADSQLEEAGFEPSPLNKKMYANRAVRRKHEGPAGRPKERFPVLSRAYRRGGASRVSERRFMGTGQTRLAAPGLVPNQKYLKFDFFASVAAKLLRVIRRRGGANF